MNGYRVPLPWLLAGGVSASWLLACVGSSWGEIRAGDWVVTTQAAPVMDRGDTLATTEIGDVFAAEQTRDGWVLVTVFKDNVKIRGWIEPSQLITLDQTITNLSQAIGEEPRNARLRRDRGTAYRIQRDFDRAIKDFDEAIRLDRGSSAAWFGRGLTYALKQDGCSRAIPDFSQAIRLDPELADAWFQRGTAYLVTGELPLAMRDLDEAIRLRPQHAPAHANRALCYYRKRELDKAMADFQAAARLNPQNAPAYDGMGWIYQDRGQLDRALGAYNQAIEADPSFGQAYNNRGNVFLTKGDLDRALADYERSIERDRRSPEPLNGRGVVHQRRGELAESLEDFGQAIEIDPRHVKALRNRALSYVRLGQYAAAEADFATAWDSQFGKRRRQQEDDPTRPVWIGEATFPSGVTGVLGPLELVTVPTEPRIGPPLPVFPPSPAPRPAAPQIR